MEFTDRISKNTFMEQIAVNVSHWQVSVPIMIVAILVVVECWDRAL